MLLRDIRNTVMEYLRKDKKLDDAAIAKLMQMEKFPWIGGPDKGTVNAIKFLHQIDKWQEEHGIEKDDKAIAKMVFDHIKEGSFGSSKNLRMKVSLLLAKELGITEAQVHKQNSKEFSPGAMQAGGGPSLQSTCDRMIQGQLDSQFAGNKKPMELKGRG